MSDQPIQVGGSGDFAGLAHLAFRGHARTARLAGAVAAGQLAHKTVIEARKLWHTHREYTVLVTSTDAIYDDVHRWLTRHMNPAGRRRVEVVTGSSDGPQVAELNGPARPAARPITIRFDGALRQRIDVDGHPVWVHVENEDRNRGDRSWSTAKIVFTCHGVTARDAVIAMLTAMNDARHDDQPRVMVHMRWGGWSRINTGPPRPLDSVVLADGQLERIVADLTQFLAEESWYVKAGVPWHRGYLLWGPPGTGKTSTAKAIAAHLGLDVYALALGDVQDDSTLQQSIGNMAPRSMLLVEDVDITPAARQRDTADSDNAGITLAGLLQALDGVTTPHGLITVLTSNRPDVLDTALVRPGRCDLVEHIDLLPADRATALFERLTGTPFCGHLPDRVVPADVVHAVLTHLHHPDRAATALTAAHPAMEAIR